MCKVEVSFEVVKNILVCKVFEGMLKENFNDFFWGNLVIVFYVEDLVVLVKIFIDFVKDNDKLVFKGGWLDGKLLDVVGVEQFLKLFGKDELRGCFFSVFMGVLIKFVCMLIVGFMMFVCVFQVCLQQFEG